MTYEDLAKKAGVGSSISSAVSTAKKVGLGVGLGAGGLALKQHLDNSPSSLKRALDRKSLALANAQNAYQQSLQKTELIGKTAASLTDLFKQAKNKTLEEIGATDFNLGRFSL